MDVVQLRLPVQERVDGIRAGPVLETPERLSVPCGDIRDVGRDDQRLVGRDEAPARKIEVLVVVPCGCIVRVQVSSCRERCGIVPQVLCSGCRCNDAEAACCYQQESESRGFRGYYSVTLPRDNDIGMMPGRPGQFLRDTLTGLSSVLYSLPQSPGPGSPFSRKTTPPRGPGGSVSVPCRIRG